MVSTSATKFQGKSARSRRLIVEIRESQGLEGLAEFKSDWKALVSRLPDAQYFQDYEWFAAYCRHAFPDDRCLRFLAVSDSRSGDVIAIVGLESRAERIRRVPFRIWGLLGSRENDVLLTAPCADMLCASLDDAVPAMDAVINHLGRSKPSAGLVLVGSVDEESMVWQATSAHRERLVKDYIRGGFSVLDTDRTYEDLEKGLAPGFRKTLRSRRRKLESMGDAQFSVVSNRDQRFSEAYEQFLNIEASGWKGAEGARSALRFKPVQRSFLEAVHHADSEVEVQIRLLTLNQETIAAEYWYRYRASMVRLKIGYDERFRQLGLGNLMMQDAVMAACADPGVRRINRVSLQPRHKDWGPNQTRWRHWRYLAVPTWRNIIPSLMLRLPDVATLRQLRVWGR